MEFFHKPVLLAETIDGLVVKKGGRYIDGTLGGGSHTAEILAKGGRVLGIDFDVKALKFVQKRFGLEIVKEEPFVAQGKDLVIVQGNFKDIEKIAKEQGLEKVEGILLDLGVSTHQLKSTEYGLSFREDTPLDMRLDHTLNVKAYDLVNNLPERSLYELFDRYGEDFNSRRIAHSISQSRLIKPIRTTGELVEIITRVSPKRLGQIHPATRIFQALRIVVNSELINLEDGLRASPGLLEKGGRLVVISFHSLEDRIVKNFFRGSGELKLITTKPVTPSEAEVKENPSSRSSKLRVAEKL